MLTILIGTLIFDYAGVIGRRIKVLHIRLQMFLFESHTVKRMACIYDY